jgi:ATP-dependent helicase HrpA
MSSEAAQKQRGNGSAKAEIEQLQKLLDACMLRDRVQLAKRLKGLARRAKQGQPVDRGLGEVRTQVERSIATLTARKDALPAIDYPEELPVSEHRAEIAAAIGKHPVVIVAGETGSGKTTQLPKICLELGRGMAGLIGHTQPRRIAARSVASRIAKELGGKVGELVGFKVRFSDQTKPESSIKLMTDGILLAEIQSDPELLAYDTIIIDEAHERSLNIDFLLGYLKRLLPRRPDLKLIITSATINTEAFSRFFDDAPVIEVSGRSYPVEIVYQPLAGDEDDQDRDLPEAIAAAVEELDRIDPVGDTLVFLPGEREIREAAEALHHHSLPHTEVIPLFSRLSPSEQDKVFQSHTGRRIVLATNVAETSLTVPGIRFVVDSGLARISRYSARSKVQRLPIEPISQASANQRAGRCGRIGPGTCVRLYAEEHFAARPLQTDPEILRTNLASVILQMESLGLGDVAAFPFMDAPESRSISDGYRLLGELEAVDEKRRLTPIGKKLARMPLDPRMARMLIAADKRRALHEVLIIVAGQSVQDPRLRPADARAKADQKHRIFQDESSDFLSWLKLWNWYHDEARHLTRSKLRKLCHDNFLSYVRLREWHDLHGQLLGIVRELKMTPNRKPAKADEIHQALLAGLLSQVGMQSEEKQYLGARGLKFAIFPGSALHRKQPKWLMAAELTETSRLFARSVAAIDPAWLETEAAHLIKRSYGEAVWSARRAQVTASEKLSLFGLPVATRRAHYGPIDPEASREIFIRHALVLGEYKSPGKFAAHNKRLIAGIEAEEAKSRRHDLLIDEEERYAIFDGLIPEGIYSGKLFEQWRKKAEAGNPKLLCLTRKQLLKGEATHSAADFPDFWHKDGLKLKLRYRFDTTHHADGVTLLVPQAALAQLEAADFDWLVPGMLSEKITLLIKGLPKSLRVHFVPAPQYAEAAMQAMHFGEGHLLLALSGALKRMSNVDVPLMQWQPEKLPAHLRMNFRITDEKGKKLAEDSDLDLLKMRFAGAGNGAPASEKTLEREGIRSWDFGELPESVTIKRGKLQLQAWPTLVDAGDSVALKLLENRSEAEAANREGVCRLFMLSMQQQVSMLQRKLPELKELLLYYATIGDTKALKDDLIKAAFAEQFLSHGIPRDQATFEARLNQGRGRLVDTARELTASLAEAVKGFVTLQQELDGTRAAVLKPVIEDIRTQMQRLFEPGFIARTPARWLREYPRYVEAARTRLEKAGRTLKQDQQHQLEVQKLWDAYLARRDDLAAKGIVQPELEEFRWQLEELRVALFAQQLKTIEPVSVKRMQKRWQELQF